MSTLPVEEAAEIAKAMSRRQRDIIRYASEPRGCPSKISGVFDTIARNLDEQGVLVFTIDLKSNYGAWRLTPLGIAVSRHLSQTAKEMT